MTRKLVLTWALIAVSMLGMGAVVVYESAELARWRARAGQAERVLAELARPITGRTYVCADRFTAFPPRANGYCYAADAPAWSAK